MRPYGCLTKALLLAAGVGLPAGTAHALTCYVVFDRSENIIYRDHYPPVDLSDAGRAEREALRNRGEFLLFVEAEECPRIEYFTGVAGTVALRLENTVTPTVQPASAPARPAAAPAPRAPRKPAGKASGSY
jgi:hypothetical protein